LDFLIWYFKDNHIDFAGGIENALRKTLDYLKQNNLNIPVEIEARSIEDVQKILKIGGAQRILLDNFNIEQTRKAVDICKGSIELESSGGITLSNVRDYALCGVDYISIGALTHHIKSLDLSLKATLKWRIWFISFLLKSNYSNYLDLITNLFTMWSFF
jgi:nicotinate-nucleotide pyrophosphorylase (carboxylating)